MILTTSAVVHVPQKFAIFLDMNLEKLYRKILGQTL